MPMAKTLGQKIRELRDAKDLSLREFGKRLGGKSAAFLSDIELGRRFPSDEVLADIARVLGIAMEELREYDSRAPIEDLRRLADSDPAFGFAFRRVVRDGVSAEDLLQFLREKKAKESNQE